LTDRADRTAFVERLHIGSDSLIQRYQANSDIDSPTVGAAVLKAATAGGLEAFLKHLGNMHRALKGHQRMSDGAVYSGTDPIEVPVMDPATGEETLVDWVEQIKGECDFLILGTGHNTDSASFLSIKRSSVPRLQPGCGEGRRDYAVQSFNEARGGLFPCQVSCELPECCAAN
jgi:hypothetical protein